MNNLLTSRIKNEFSRFPLYSQDGKGMDAICITVFYIGKARWYILEGQKEGDDHTMFGIVCGLGETEYGYVLLSELENIVIDGSKHGFPGMQFKVCELEGFTATALKNIQDAELKSFLNNMYN